MTIPTTKYADEAVTSYKKGIDYQRELFKDAKHENNYDKMCDSLENIKSEIKRRVLNKKRKNVIQRIEQIINWYRNLETQYIKNTPEGKIVVFPPNMHNKVNNNLTICYELIIQELDLLELL